MNGEELSAFAEEVHNGEAINWDYWASLSNITTAQAARLVYHIDPFNKRPGMKFMGGVLPDDLRDKIAKLEQWLGNHRAEWNLNDLAFYLGDDFIPHGMVQQLEKRQRELNAKHEPLEEQLLNESIKSGRYTLELAALFISRNSRSNFESIKDELKKAVENDELKFYDTDKDEPFKPTRIREFLGEVFWDDLNGWLKNNLPRLGCFFPKPDSLKEVAQVLPKTEKPETKEWKAKAWEIGEEWMIEQRNNGENPGVIAIAKYVEGELSNRNITGARGKFLDFETIKREALTGITGRLPNGKNKIS